MRFKSILFITSLFLFANTAANNNFSIKTVVIDAGHGGKDPGASGPGKTNEKDIALAVALKLGDYISKNFPDVNVIYTRKTDVFLELHERAEIANKAKADLFIAVHVNSSTNPDVYGTSSYVLGLHRTEANLEVAKRENAVILLEDNRDKNYEFDPNSPEGHIIMSMKLNAFLDQSIDLASKVENQFENFSKRKSLGVKQAGFYVLYKTTMPSLLTEIGFISNPEEEKFLQNSKGQEQIATALLNAFRSYKAGMEGNVGEKPVAEQKEEAKPVKPEVKTETKAETKPEPKAETPVVMKETEPVKAVAEIDPDVVTVQSGKNIHKPIESNHGGGKAAPKPEPVILKEEPKTVAEVKPPVEKKEEPKPVEKKEEPKTLKKEEEAKPIAPVKSEVKEEAKTPVKEEAKTETKPTVETPVQKTGNGIIFKVQLFALKSEVKAAEYSKAQKLFNPVSKETLPNGITRYYGGNANSYTAIKSVLELAKTSGYPDAYIVGFKDGTRLTVEQMRAFEK